jgi:hypothetical protein
MQNQTGFYNNLLSQTDVTDGKIKYYRTSLMAVKTTQYKAIAIINVSHV